MAVLNFAGWRIREKEGCAAVGLVTADLNHGQSKQFFSFPLNVAHFRLFRMQVYLIPIRLGHMIDSIDQLL